MKRLGAVLVLLLLIVLPVFAQDGWTRGDLIRAEYGSGSRWVDVTQRVRSLIRSESLRFRVDNDTLGVDPRPGEAKELRLQFRDENGRTRQLTFQENQYVNLRVSGGGSAYGPSHLQILRAVYGAGNRFSDVTARLNSQIQGDQLNLQVNNDTMGGDPSPNQSKTLTVQYAYNDQQGRVAINEGDYIRLPEGSATYQGSLQILRAVYGAGNRFSDVTNRLNSQIQGDQLNLQVTNDTMGGDPSPNQSKTLTVQYTYNGSSAQAIVNEGNYLSLPGSDSSRGEISYNEGPSQTIRCESNNNARNYCPVDTRGGVRLSRQISGSACTQGSTWGYDSRGVWVDNGCRADFEVLPVNYGSVSSASQTIRCESPNNARRYCPVDTRGGVRLSRQISGSACTQGSTWGYDNNRIWVDNGCRADFEVLPVGYGSVSSSSQTIRCESNNNARNYCPADTRGGVRLTRQISGSACTQGSTWGYDNRGVWVDNGCRAEFQVMPAGYGSVSTSSQTIRCESNNNARNYCPVDTRGGVRLSRQISGSACTQGSTWGYDSRGVWVDNGCRAEFQVSSPFGTGASSTPYGTYTTIPSGTQLAIRTNEVIDSATSAVGQKFSALMYADVLDSSGAVAIPRGSDVELVIRSTAGSDLVLDIDSLVVSGQRYVVSTSDLEQKGGQGIGANRRTAEMVGGGAAVGAIIGAILGGGKGAAIGAGVGAAGGAGVEVLTKGKQVKVPAETILNFRLDTDLRLQPAR